MIDLRDLASLEARATDLDALIAELEAFPEETVQTLAPDLVLGRRTARVVASALALDRAFLRAHPEELFARLWNRLRWYDAPDAAAFFELPGTAPWARSDAHLHRLAEHWRATRTNARPWLASLRPLRGHPDATDKLLLGHESQVLALAFDREGKRLLSGSWDDGRNVRIWDVATGACTLVLDGHDCEVLGVAWSPDGSLVASGSRSDDAKVWDARTGELRHELDGQEGRVTSVAFSADGTRYAAGNLGWIARVVTLATGAVLTLEGHEQSVLTVAFDPRGRWLATGSSDETARVWDLATGKCVQVLEGLGTVRSVAFDATGERLAAGGAQAWRVFETSGWTTVCEGEAAEHVAWLPDGRLALQSWQQVSLHGADGTLLVSRAEPPGESERAVAFHPDGARYAITEGTAIRLARYDAATPPTPGRDDKIRGTHGSKALAFTEFSFKPAVIDATGAVRTLETKHFPHPGSPWVASADGTRFAHVFSDYTAGSMGVATYDATTLTPGPEIRAPRCDAHGLDCGLAMTADGSRVAFAVNDDVVRVHDARTGRAIAAFEEDRVPVSKLAFAFGDAWVVAASKEAQRVRVLDPGSRRTIVDERVTFLPDGPVFATCDRARVAFGNADGEATVVDVIMGGRRVVARHPSEVLAIGLSADGKWVASGSRDGTVHLFSLDDERLVATIPHEGAVGRVAITGDWLITVTSKQRSAFFDVRTGAKLFELAAVVDAKDVVRGSPWIAFGDVLTVHRDGATPLTTFPDGMNEVQIVGGKILVCRGLLEPGAFYLLELRDA